MLYDAGRFRVLVALGALVMALLLVAPAARASCGSPANAIEAENCQPGTPASVWDITGAGSASLQGYATDISVDQGQTVHFKVDTDASDYRLDIYRLGWYGGDGARRVATVQPSVSLPQNQPACAEDDTTGLVDCGDWAESASWSVPARATSGIYFAHLVREDGTFGESHIPFVVRDDDGRSNLLFQTSDTTWQAYNQYGGNSLYVGDSAACPGRACKVSYNRPFTTRGTSDEDWLFNAEYPMVRFLERNGYDVSYSTGVDTDRRAAELLEHRAFLSVGHDEYWSGEQRANVTAARDAGVNLAFVSGNEMFWKTRWEDDHRTLVSYKETHANAKIDPLPATWTGTWRDPRPFNPEGGRPENALSGTIFMVNSGTVAMQVPAADGRMRFWRGTSLADLPSGATATLADGTVGYEWDEDLDNGARPPGLIRLSTTQANGVEVLQDFGSTYGPGNATHHLTLYRAASGALVFGAGTVQWPWGLDNVHERGSAPADARMQQATVNLFADMGVQAATLQPGLLAAAASTDRIAPTTTITSVSTRAVSGTATDYGGGVVAGVEVSLDGGVSWHPASGRESWTYAGTPGPAGVRAHAVDDSGNLEGREPGPPPPATTPVPPVSSVPPGPPAPGAGAGSGPAVPGALPVDRTAPRVRVSPGRVRASLKGIVKLRVSCSRGERRCRVRLRLRLRHGDVASKTLTVAGGSSRVVSLQLRRPARRELARRRSLKVTAIVVARDAAGNAATGKTSIRLLAPKLRR